MVVYSNVNNKKKEEKLQKLFKNVGNATLIYITKKYIGIMKISFVLQTIYNSFFPQMK